MRAQSISATSLEHNPENAMWVGIGDTVKAKKGMYIGRRKFSGSALPVDAVVFRIDQWECGK
jgi:hypothetical protein